MTLYDLLKIPRSGKDRVETLDEFLADPRVAQLQWPRDVVDQWLWEHGDNPEFLDDYGTLALEAVHWTLELRPLTELVHVPTGPSDGDVLEINAKSHEHWVRGRLPEVMEAWETDGTWLRPPILIARALLDPPASGLQVVEGRTRMGVLRGRHRAGLHVAGRHSVWVGR
ncbi:hypothetical protein BOX37_01455 [Nocardia mangyaensis]|uniref:Uncharacterized protein n=1 Tax=Nocardia mangyaensis TaxID=2213200 RepID=A0A1J0VLH1_9NOCA|nr:hypothetical protein [Nocardia mangyaensis]APE32855.1 hypothetical protein BOX37_01455 [Nocardia mangyaensis]